VKWIAMVALALAVIVKPAWRHSYTALAVPMNATTRRELIAMNSLAFWILLVIGLTFSVIALIKRFD
jgi:hypothetical protein